MENLIYFGIVFALVFIVYLVFINPRRLKKNNIQKMGEVAYIIGKFKLDKNKINLKSLVYTISFINTLIMAFVCMVVAAIPLKMMYQLLIGFVLLFALIYSIYEIYGHILIKKYRK